MRWGRGIRSSFELRLKSKGRKRSNEEGKESKQQQSGDMRVRGK